MSASQEEQINVKFSGEECLGRFVDMYELHQRYIDLCFRFNLPKLDYSDYLLHLCTNNHGSIKTATLKATREYREYVSDLLEYFVSFLDRAHPLTDLHPIFSKVESEFWAKNYHQCKNRKTKLATALIEAKVNKLCNTDVLKDTIARTRERVENRFAMTYQELVEDRKVEEDHDSMTKLDDEENDKTIKNPLRLPMGADGKPIPYWLYKLHGLKQEFRCEICGDSSYKGRREFERHFREERHQFGMNCLGIPSGYKKSFYEITKIDDARKLWEEIQRKEEVRKWDPEAEEEFEDDNGNVYDKKTYHLLKTQGLI